jgi:hypothetical protein
VSAGDLDHPWEQWVGSTARPVEVIKRGAKVDVRDGRRWWIIYRDEINGQRVIVEMPSNAPTASCDKGRHDHCPHRLGGPQEGGVVLKLSLPGFTWRCGCPCHNDPLRAGRLF